MSSIHLLNNGDMPYNKVFTSVHSGANTDGSLVHASCTLLDVEGGVLDAISPLKPRNEDGSVVHAELGSARRDHHGVTVNLSSLHPQVAALYFALHSPDGYDLSYLSTGETGMMVYEDETVRLVPYRCALSEFGQGQGVVVAGFLRVAGNGWLAHEVGVQHNYTSLPMGLEQLYRTMQRHQQVAMKSL